MSKYYLEMQTQSGEQRKFENFYFAFSPIYWCYSGANLNIRASSWFLGEGEGEEANAYLKKSNVSKIIN